MAAAHEACHAMHGNCCTSSPLLQKSAAASYAAKACSNGLPFCETEYASSQGSTQQLLPLASINRDVKIPSSFLLRLCILNKACCFWT